MSSDIAISVKNLSKTYRIFGHPGDRIKQALTFGRMRFHKEFTALHDVSFEIRKGETVGIIGRNGSGKSTLLQLICGILKPTSGIVTVNGRVSALLELGAGFNPEFTGRENAYFQGALTGLTRAEMDARFDEIIAFAEIGEFIDQPVRTYSSGMYVRLAFSVAVALDPTILVVDEALSVGDAGFQQKCLKRFIELKEKGVTVVLVTHDILLARNYCERLVYLDSGRVKLIGGSEDAGNLYLSNTLNEMQQSSPVNQLGWNRSSYNESDSDRKKALITRIRMSEGSSSGGFSVGEPLIVSLQAEGAARLATLEFVVQFRDTRGYILFGVNTEPQHIHVAEANGHFVYSSRLIVQPSLLPGIYSVSVSLNDRASIHDVDVIEKITGAVVFQISPKTFPQKVHGCINMNAEWQ